jgi:hypothetical protein
VVSSPEVLRSKLISSKNATSPANIIIDLITITIRGLVVRVSGYRFRGTRVRFLALPDFLRSSGSGTGSTQPREDN